MKTLARTVAVALLLLLTLAVPVPPLAHGATLTVTDCGDATPGGTPGQLRFLITQAASGDTIVIPPCTITLTGAAGDDTSLTGDLDITKSLNIQGVGPGQTIIDGGGIDRVLDINPTGAPNVVVMISGVTIRNGNAADLDGGGGILIGKTGINGGTLTLTNCVVSANRAMVFGGGIANNRGTVMLINTTVSSNISSSYSAGIDNTDGTVTLIHSTVNGNAATAAGRCCGGITSSPAAVTPTVTLIDSTVSGNTSGSGGGAGISAAGVLTLTNTTVSGNVATGSGATGGGLQVGGTVTIVNSTISGNAANGGPSAAGGGVVFQFSSGTLTLTNTTIVGNTTTGAGGGLGLRSGTTTVKNTIIANNAASNGNNCKSLGGTLTSHGHNLSSDGSCLSLTGLGDLNSTDPMLGPLQPNGGPTPTHALLAGSPAIDAGDNAGCPATDQRGVPRPQDARVAGTAICDIGAFEVETLGFITAALTLNTATVAPGTLLEGALTVANAGAARPLDVYVFFVPPAGVALGCPGGDPVVFLTLSGAALTCVSSGVQAFTPLFSNVTLAADLFTPIAVPVFSLTWPAAPTGAWLAGIALTPVGAFSDGRVNPFADLVIATAGFTAGP